MQFEWLSIGIIVCSLLLLIIACFLLMSGSWFGQWLRGTIGLVLVAVSAYASLFAINLFTFSALEQERPIATVSFAKNSYKNYSVTVAQMNDQRAEYEIHGDAWQLDIRVLQFNDILASVVDYQLYQLDRIQGRYFSLEDELSNERTVYSLSTKNIGFDIWQQVYEGFSFLFTAKYGSATYVPMVDGAIYEVVLGNSGIVARPLNKIAEQELRRWE